MSTLTTVIRSMTSLVKCRPRWGAKVRDFDPLAAAACYYRALNVLLRVAKEDKRNDTVGMLIHIRRVFRPFLRRRPVIMWPTRNCMGVCVRAKANSPRLIMILLSCAVSTLKCTLSFDRGYLGFFFNIFSHVHGVYVTVKVTIHAEICLRKPIR